MNAITKPSFNSLRVHAATPEGKPLCGIGKTNPDWQTDLAEPNCKLCARTANAHLTHQNHMTKLDEINLATKDFADARQELSAIVSRVNRLQEAIYKRYLAAIKRLLAKAAERQVKLEALIDASPDLFTRPRTLIVHGIRIGFRKGRGGIEWEEDAQVVKLIKKLFPKQADILIHTEEKPVKSALQELPTADLKRLGITVEDTGDVVVIKPVDSEVDKIVKALLKNAIDEKEAA